METMNFLLVQGSDDSDFGRKGIKEDDIRLISKREEKEEEEE